MSQPSVELLMLGGGLSGGQWRRDGQSCKSTVQAKYRRRIVKRSRVNVRWSEEEENCTRQHQAKYGDFDCVMRTSFGRKSREAQGNECGACRRSELQGI